MNDGLFFVVEGDGFVLNAGEGEGSRQSHRSTLHRYYCCCLSHLSRGTSILNLSFGTKEFSCLKHYQSWCLAFWAISFVLEVPLYLEGSFLEALAEGSDNVYCL